MVMRLRLFADKEKDDDPKEQMLEQRNTPRRDTSVSQAKMQNSSTGETSKLQI